MVIRGYTECSWALLCKIYNSEAPCEKPSYRPLRKPLCYIPKKEKLISKLAKKTMKGIMKLIESTRGGALED